MLLKWRYNVAAVAVAFATSHHASEIFGEILRNDYAGFPPESRPIIASELVDADRYADFIGYADRNKLGLARGYSYTLDCPMWGDPCVIAEATR